MSDDRRGIPPGWTSYMVSDEDGATWEAEHLRRDPMYATWEEAWAEVDRDARLIARHGALALILTQVAAMSQGLRDAPDGIDADEDRNMVALWGQVAQQHVALAEVFRGSRKPETHLEEETVRVWAEMMDQIRGKDR